MRKNLDRFSEIFTRKRFCTINSGKMQSKTINAVLNQKLNYIAISRLVKTILVFRQAFGNSRVGFLLACGGSGAERVGIPSSLPANSKAFRRQMIGQLL